MINVISSFAMPMMIFIIIFYGIKEKKNVFDIFLNGAKDGIEIVMKLFPTLIGLFLAIEMLRESGIITKVVELINPIIILFKIPSEIMPLALLRPISGSASIAVATDIMNQYGVDSMIGIISSTIMGATETTLYTISIYTSVVGIKNIRFVLIASLAADIVGMLVSVVVCRNLS